MSKRSRASEKKENHDEIVHTLMRTIRMLRRRVESGEKKIQELEKAAAAASLTSHRSRSLVSADEPSFNLREQDDVEEVSQQPEHESDDDGHEHHTSSTPTISVRDQVPRPGASSLESMTLSSKHDEKYYLVLDIADHKRMYFKVKGTTKFHKVIRAYLLECDVLQESVLHNRMEDEPLQTLRVSQIIEKGNDIRGIQVEEHKHMDTKAYHMQVDAFVNLDALINELLYTSG